MSQVQGRESVPVEVKDPLSVDERAELERLRQENTALRTSARPPRRRIRWRSVVAAVLLVLGCLLAPVSLVAVWTHNQVSDTDRFVETVGPLVGDPAVQEALTNRVTTTVFEYVDVEGLAKEAIAALAAQGLPPPARPAVGLLHPHAPVGSDLLRPGQGRPARRQPAVRVGVEPGRPDRPPAGGHRALG